MNIVRGYISELPSPQQLEKPGPRRYATVPVYCLALIKRDNWGFGFLLVTDFTDNYRNSVFNNTIPSNVPCEFTVGDTKLEKSKVFAISVPANKIETCWAELKRYSQKMNDYSYLDYERCIFLQEGVVALVNFGVRAHRQSVEGFLFNISVCNRKMLLIPSNQANVNDHGFKEFISRFSRFITPKLHDTLMPVFPVDKYFTRAGMGPPKTHLKPLKPEETVKQPSLPPRKARRLGGVQVVYQQQFSQSQDSSDRKSERREARRLEREFPDRDEAGRRSKEYAVTQERRNGEYHTNDEYHGNDEDYDYGRGSPGQNGSQHSIRDLENGDSAEIRTLEPWSRKRDRSNSKSRHAFNTNTSGSSRMYETESGSEFGSEESSLPQASTFPEVNRRRTEPPSEWEQHIINKVDFSKFASIPCHQIRPGTVFSTTCKIQAMVPDPGHIIVKPYQRTLKIPSLAIFLSSGDKMVRVELHSEKEKCLFFGIPEIEDAINHISIITGRLQLLIGAELEVSLENRALPMNFDWVRLYWCPVNTLEQMSECV